MLLDRNSVITVFSKYKITRAEIGSTDNAQEWFEFHIPRVREFSWVRQDDNLLYSCIAQGILKDWCKDAGIDFQVLDNELGQCKLN